MTSPQFLPIPPQLRALACETLNRRVGRLPLIKDGVEITETLVGTTLECLNAEATRTLPVKTAAGESFCPGLDQCLSGRLGGERSTEAVVIAGVLTDAGLGEPAVILDAATHHQIRGIRLLSAWAWHIGSGEVSPGTCQYTGDGDGWLACCPVCRTGILGQVTGKRLFGIPPTDYYLDCSHCGAKFIPEKDRFRLVSIARISDPRWRQYLNSCRTPEDWAALLREETTARQVRPARSIATSRYRISPPKPQPVLREFPVQRAEKIAVPVEGVAVPFSSIRDGSLVVSGTTKTLYFRPVTLRFLRGTRHDLFCHAERSLEQVLNSPVYADVKPLLAQEYERYLPLRIGPVTEELRKKSDPRYRQLLNRYGDREFSSFAVEDPVIGQKKGVLLVFLQGKLCYITACHTTFSDLIDRTFGTISPDCCYLDGNADACRINSLATAFRDAPVFWIHENDDDRAIEVLVADLQDRYLKGFSAPAGT